MGDGEQETGTGDRRHEREWGQETSDAEPEPVRRSLDGRR